MSLTLYFSALKNQISANRKELESTKKRFNEVSEKLMERNRQHQKLQPPPEACYRLGLTSRPATAECCPRCSCGLRHPWREEPLPFHMRDSDSSTNRRKTARKPLPKKLPPLETMRSYLTRHLCVFPVRFTIVLLFSHTFYGSMYDALRRRTITPSSFDGQLGRAPPAALRGHDSSFDMPIATGQDVLARQSSLSNVLRPAGTPPEKEFVLRPSSTPVQLNLSHQDLSSVHIVQNRFNMELGTPSKRAGGTASTWSWARPPNGQGGTAGGLTEGVPEGVPQGEGVQLNLSHQDLSSVHIVQNRFNMELGTPSKRAGGGVPQGEGVQLNLSHQDLSSVHIVQNRFNMELGTPSKRAGGTAGGPTEL
ncbi:cyclin B1 interacting protein 1, E3 ubiquitin protein ligase [Branchiostoma belcheri]|nr:cyclin B1 interacting protein 1, E3 ubiquitin protein ligase [Branchiostoma belcheri]